MSAERVQPLDFDREDCEDHVWHLIHNIQSTPALNQKWKDTECRSSLLTFLKIDPKNVVRWFFEKKIHTYLACKSYNLTAGQKIQKSPGKKTCFNIK